jgi:hypothetical protein
MSEKENKYFSYWVVRRRNNYGYLVKALNGSQAMAQVRHFERINDQYLCVKEIQDD